MKRHGYIVTLTLMVGILCFLAKSAKAHIPVGLIPVPKKIALIEVEIDGDGNRKIIRIRCGDPGTGCIVAGL